MARQYEKLFKFKIKIFHHQTKNNFAIINKKFKKKFEKKKFLGKLIFPKIKDYMKIKLKINNSYLTSKINDENMSQTLTHLQDY